MAVDFITTGKLGYAMQNACVGVYVLDEKTGQVHTFRSDVTVLARGCGKVYLYTTNPQSPRATGWPWPGARARDREHGVRPVSSDLPLSPEAKSFLIRRPCAARGPSCAMKKAAVHGSATTPARSSLPRNRGPRHRAEMKRTGSKCVYLDITHKPADFIQHRFPKIYETCLKFGIDITKQPIPVVPAAHYQCGGVKTDLYGEPPCADSTIGEVELHRSPWGQPPREQFPPRGLVLAHRAYEKTSRRRPKSVDFNLPEWRARPGAGSSTRWSSSITTGTRFAASCGITSASCARRSASSAPRPAAQSPCGNPGVLTGTSPSRGGAGTPQPRRCRLAHRGLRDEAPRKPRSHYTLDYLDPDEKRFKRRTTMRRI